MPKRKKRGKAGQFFGTFALSTYKLKDNTKFVITFFAYVFYMQVHLFFHQPMHCLCPMSGSWPSPKNVIGMPAALVGLNNSKCTSQRHFIVVVGRVGWVRPLSHTHTHTT